MFLSSTPGEVIDQAATVARPRGALHRCGRRRPVSAQPPKRLAAMVPFAKILRGLKGSRSGHGCIQGRQVWIVRDGSKRSLIRWAKEPFHAMPTVRRHARTAAHESRSAVSQVT